MESGAKGCEIIVSGKLRGQRAKAMKFVDGLLIHSGDPTNHFIARAVKHVELRQGVLGIKIKIMLNYDPTGKSCLLFLFVKLDFESRVRSRFLFTVKLDCYFLTFVTLTLCSIIPSFYQVY